MRVPVYICQGISADRASCVGNCQIRVLVHALCIRLVYRVIWMPTAAQSFSPGEFYSQVRALFLPEAWEKAQDTAGVRWRTAIMSGGDKRKPCCRVATSSRLSSASLEICRVAFFAGLCSCHLMESVRYSFIWEFHHLFR